MFPQTFAFGIFGKSPNATMKPKSGNKRFSPKKSPPKSEVDQPPNVSTSPTIVPEKVSNSSSMKGKSLVEKKWVIIVTLIVSIVGGAPGIISIIEWSSKKPIIKYANIKSGFAQVSYYTDSLFVNKKSANIAWLLGSLTNFGQTPFLMSYFKCYITNQNGDTLKLHPMFLDQFHGSNFKDIFPQWEKETTVDLTRSRVLEPQNFVSGMIICRTDTSYSYMLHNFGTGAVTHLTFIDQADKEYNLHFDNSIYHE